MKIETRASAKFLRAPDRGCRAILLFGPDGGLVRERGASLARLVADDLADPFRVSELTGEMIEGDPARLADEAAALSLSGGRRVVRVRPAGNEAAEAFAGFLKHPVGDALVVVEAGELDGRSALRKLFETATNAAAVACYRDEGAGLAAVISDTLAGFKVSAAADAAQWLAERLGGDRQVTRSELEKLALYVGAGNTASLEDARACVGDSAEIDLDDLVNATARGDAPALARALDRLWAEGATPIKVLRAAQRHFTRLHLCAGLIAGGCDDASAMKSLRPPVFWKEVASFGEQLRRWPLPRLAHALDRLLATEMECKRAGQSPMADLLVGQALLDLAGGRR